MNELLVEWTLLKNKEYLDECLALKTKRKLFQQYSTKYGRIDFAHELANNRIIITELETIIDSTAKLEYCKKQTTEYQRISFQDYTQPQVIILIAQETPENYKREIAEFSRQKNILLRFYSLSEVSKHYKRLIEDAIKNSGIPLSKPVANNFTHLACLNRLFLPFYEKKALKLDYQEFIPYFNLRRRRANSHFRVHAQMAKYFDLIEVKFPPFFGQCVKLVF